MKVEKALSILQQQNYKYTGKREKMIRILACENRFLSAKEMLKLMQDEYPSTSFDTIYRNLTLFKELQLIEETELNNERLFRFHCADHHHHHIICTSCGYTEAMKKCPLSESYDPLPNGFTVESHKFEVYGICSDCNQAEG